MSKVYKVKSSANRAGKKALESAAKGTTFVVLEAEGGFIFELTTPVPDDGILRASTVESPCVLVWAIAEDMEGSKRKDIIAACVEAGIAYYTARTQYQKYIEAKRGDVK